MTKLEIPRAALDALSDAVEGGARGDTAPVVHRIAAPVVVAELRRLVAELDHPYDDEARNLLVRRADELDGADNPD